MASSTPWVGLEIKIPGQDLLSSVQGFCETLVVFLDIAKVILNLIKAFLVSIGNPVQALVMTAIALVNNVLESLRQTGLYWWYNLPDFSEDPSCKRLDGGYPAFVERWKGSLLDSQDINRPKPLAGFNTGFFLMLVVDANNVGKIIQACQTLAKFFGMSEGEPSTFSTPSSLKLTPVDKYDNPIAISKLLNTPATSIALDWSLGSNTKTPDPSHTGLSSVFSAELPPPNWLIERSLEYPNNPVTEFDRSGKLIYEYDSAVKDPRTNKTVKEKIDVYDSFGQPVILMEEAYVANAQTASDIFTSIGFFGKYRYLDKDVEVDKTYYYRVRGFSGELSLNGNKIAFDGNSIKQDPSRGVYRLDYPGKDLVMGKATPIMQVRLPKLPEKFDVREHFFRTFLAGFSLGFALGVNLVKKVGADGKPILGANGYPEYEPFLDGNGDPIPPRYSNSDIGKATLTKIAGPLSGYVPDLTAVKSQAQVSTNTQWGLKAPWTMWDYQSQATKMADFYVSLAISAGSTFINGFKSLMETVPPFGPPENFNLRRPPSTIYDARDLSELIFKLTDFSPVSPFQVGTTEVVTQWTTSVEGVNTFGQAYSDKIVRKNVLAAVNYILTLGYQGQPPDWNKISLMGDLIPWSSNMIYEILNVVQALIDGFNDLTKEIKQFIDMIIRKIDVIESFIEYLVMIIDYIKSFSLGVYCLAAWDLSGGVSSWFSALDGAGGTKPPSTGRGSYTGGICLAGVAPDVSALQSALKLIFGG